MSTLPDDPMLTSSLWYGRLGWRVVPNHSPKPGGGCTCEDSPNRDAKGPCDSPGKHPRIADWTAEATTDEATIRRWWERWPGASVGLATGPGSGFFVLDVDGDEGLASLRELEEMHGELPRTVRQISGSGGYHYLFNYPSDRKIPSQAKKLAPGLDTRGEGGQIVAAPSPHASGGRYSWDAEGDPRDVDIANAPKWLLDEIDKAGRRGTRREQRSATLAKRATPEPLDRVESCLDHLSPKRADGRDDWLQVGMAIHQATGGSAEGFGLWDEWSRTSDNYGGTREAWDSFDADREAGITFGSLIAWARADSGNPGLFKAAPRETVLYPAHPDEIAKRFLADLYAHAEHATLAFQADDFLRWRDGRWQYVEREEIRAQVYAYLADKLEPGEKGAAKYKATRSRVDNILDALRAVAHIPAAKAAPCWLIAEERFDPVEILALRNGLLHVPTRTLIPHTPRFFTRNAVDYDFNCKASKPSGWIDFLHELWPDDEPAIATLQEWIGLSLLPITRYQKILILCGPRRAGKGTIARIQTAMLGTGNIGTPTLSSFASAFGLAPLVGKLLAILSDARLSGKADQAAIVERLLSISGEDLQQIDRKYREPYEGKIPARIQIMTNELPKLPDVSGALAGRFIVLSLTRSFFGNEDHALSERLLREREGILLWALEGLDRLIARGRFIQPDSGAEMIEDLENLGSPVGAFVRELCSVGPGRSVGCAELFAAWEHWCRIHGRENPGNSQAFARDLRAVIPGLKTSHPREGTKRVRRYEGVGLGDPLERDGTRSFPIVRGGWDGKGREGNQRDTNSGDRGPSRSSPLNGSALDEERAGIYEFDARLSHDDAELLAAEKAV